MTNLSLRARLFLLVTAALCLTAGPLLYVAYRAVNAVTLELEQKSFSDILVMEEESINSSYLNLLANKVSSVVERKTRLAEAARQARAASRDMAGAAGLPDDLQKALSVGIMRRLASDTLWLDRFDRAALADGHVNLPGFRPDIRDAKGRTLADLLAQLPPDGDFAVFHLPVALRVAGGTFAIAPSVIQPVLAFFLPGDHGDGGDVLVAMTPLQDLEERAAAAEQAVIRATQDKFDTLSIYRNGFIALLDRNGRALAFRGDGDPPDASALRPWMDEARRHGRAEALVGEDRDNGTGGSGDMLHLFAYTPAFDWYVVMAAPMSEIRAPSTALISRLLPLAGAALVTALAAALIMLGRALRPLDLLTRKTEALPGMDFSDPKTEELIARDLPLDRGDEVGRLARAFAFMGRTLSENIRALMEATASKERMEGELNAARDIQLGILPPPDGAPAIFGFTASAFLDPAKEVGGDLYDYFTTPDGRNALVLGDVSGKGVPAALFMSMAVTLVRYALRGGLDPATAMIRINEQLEEHNPGNMFVTLFLALYDPKTGDLEYANGGHCPPYVAQKAPGGPVRALEGLSGPMVGVLPGVEYILHRDRLEEGELCLLFTDGVTEAMNAKKELYGEERLVEFLSLHGGDDPKTLLGRVFAELVRYRGDEPQSDDITMLAFARR